MRPAHRSFERWTNASCLRRRWSAPRLSQGSALRQRTCIQSISRTCGRGAVARNKSFSRPHWVTSGAPTGSFAASATNSACHLSVTFSNGCPAVRPCLSMENPHWGEFSHFSHLPSSGGSFIVEFWAKSLAELAQPFELGLDRARCRRLYLLRWRTRQQSGKCGSKRLRSFAFTPSNGLVDCLRRNRQPPSN